MKFKEMNMLQTKQKGFTLLELLVVITLLAVLSVGALIAYEGIGENANNVAAANNIKVADSAIRTFRALEGVYPNQWDNLAPVSGAAVSGATEGPLSVMADATLDFFGQWNVASTASGTVWERVANALNRVGINELQSLEDDVEIDLALTSPNQAWNESSPGVSEPADELSWEDGFDTVQFDNAAISNFNISIVPSGGTAGVCAVDGTPIVNNFNGDNVGTLNDNKRLNFINDNLDDDGCDLVLALGFGKDVPGTTTGSRVAISTAPTYTNGNVVNPSVHYARYVALFHVATAEDGAAIEPTDVFTTPRLLAVVDTEGRTIDQAIAGAFASDRARD
jgi:prepilin-type N-terminal cleavage/methylation domain-containing protein